MDVIVDDLDIPNERLAWIQAAEDLRKPVYLRTESEVSRILTLISRLQYVQQLSFQERFALTKVAQFRTVSVGEVVMVARGNLSLLEDTTVSPKRDAQGDGTGDDNRGKGSSLSTSNSRSAFATSGSSNAPTKMELALQAAEELDRDSAPLPEHVYLIVFGSVGLRVEAAHGRVQSVLGKGDVVGNPLLESALPPKSHFVALEPVELLSFTRAQYVELLSQVDAEELRVRVQFFKSLLVPVLSPWSDDQILALAKQCYPMRLQSKELIVKEGSPADAMYFLQTGKLKVVREVDFAPSSNNTMVSANATLSGTLGTTLGTQAQQAQVRLLELATLQEGEFFGELSLIRYRVDDNRKMNILKLLAGSSTASGEGGTSGGGGAGNPSRRGTTRRTVNHHHHTGKHHLGNTAGSVTGSGGVAGGGTTTSMMDLLHSVQSGAGMSDSDNSSDSGDDETRALNPKKAPLLRQATVYAHTPATVLVLPRASVMRLVRGPALVRLREYAKGYPSQQDIRNHFMRQEKWDAFKSDLINEVRGNPPAHGAGGGGSSRKMSSVGGSSRRHPSQSPRR